MNKIADYKTVAGTNGKELDAAVKTFLDKGYQPYGNPYLMDNVVKSRGEDFCMFQAMVKMAPPTPIPLTQ